MREKGLKEELPLWEKMTITFHGNIRKERRDFKEETRRARNESCDSSSNTQTELGET